MAEQGAEPGVGGLDRGTHAALHIDPQRQGIDEHPQGAVGARAALHAAHQHGAEHHLATVGQLPQHQAPGQVHQGRGAHPQVPRLLPQAPAQGLARP
nr:hypothetical protein [Pseudomonas protegens]